MTSRSHHTVTVAKITVVGTVAVAIISLIGNLILGYWQLAEKAGEAVLPAPVVPAFLEIEQIPLDAFAYGGNNNPDGGFGTFVLINDGQNIPNYKLDYFLPEDKHGYAGLAFDFHESMDLSEYSAMECTIIFGQPLDEIDLYVKDMGGNFNTIRVVGNVSNEMVLRYEFRNFPNINFNAVKEIGVVSSTDFLHGTHQAVLKNIRFTK